MPCIQPCFVRENYLLWFPSYSVCLICATSHGQAVHVQDLHRAGAQEQQHHCVHVDGRDHDLLYSCVHHCHDMRAVRYEDLAAEERKLTVMVDMYCNYL